MKSTASRKSPALARPAPTATNSQDKPSKSPDQTISKKMINPKITALFTMRKLQPMLKQTDTNELVVALNDEVSSVLSGKMGRAEEMLVTQAHTLDMLFGVLTQRAAANMNDGYLQATDTYMRLALKAQSQCRTTLEALSEIKNPRSATFIKQQNVAGQQQVNNGQTAHEKNITPSNELLTEGTHEALDTAGAGQASRGNQKVVAMAAVNRT